MELWRSTFAATSFSAVHLLFLPRQRDIALDGPKGADYSMCAAQSIRELCIALFHRWEPERILVIITAYFDESGTHRSSPVSMMAGHVGDARQWQKFEKRISKLFRRYHVDVFHAMEIKRSDKDFRGWSVNKKIDFVDEFS
ncbi:MAG: hypothetical protein WA231_11725, partial [Methylocella sp.]